MPASALQVVVALSPQSPPCLPHSGPGLSVSVTDLCHLVPSDQPCFPAMHRCLVLVMIKIYGLPVPVPTPCHAPLTFLVVPAGDDSGRNKRRAAGEAIFAGLLRPLAPARRAARSDQF